jgi:hypothetical protein
MTTLREQFISKREKLRRWDLTSALPAVSEWRYLMGLAEVCAASRDVLMESIDDEGS